MKSESTFQNLSVSRRIESLQARFSNAAAGEQSHAELGALIAEEKRIWQERLQSHNQRITPIQRKYCFWLTFLANERNLALHIKFISRLHQRLSALKNQQRIIEIKVFPHNTIFSYSASKKQINLKVHEALIGMSDQALDQFVALLFKPNKAELSRLMRAQYFDPKLEAVRSYFEQATVPQTGLNQPEGKWFNLEEIFDEVNRNYFAGKLEKPALHWSARPNKVRMGTYHFKQDSVMINRALDETKTPRFVISYILYHELLHKKLGVQMKNGRSRAHNAKFRKLEKQFGKWQEAEAYIAGLKVKKLKKR